MPRVGPSQEQLIGARALAGGPSVAMIHPAELSAARMAWELQALLRRPASRPDADEDDGALTAARILCEMAATVQVAAA